MDESLLTFGCEIFCSENSFYFVLIKMTSSILASDALPIHVNACFLLPLTTKKIVSNCARTYSKYFLVMVSGLRQCLEQDEELLPDCRLYKELEEE